jgi:hypothetical protein
MTTKQRIKLRMYLAVRNFVSQNETIAKAIPKFSESYATLQNATNDIQLIGEIQGVDKSGVAIDKNKLKANLIAIAVKNSRKISAFAKFSNNDTLLSEVRYNESDLIRMQEVALKENCQIIYDRCQANIQSLTENGITPDTQKAFLDAITAFNNALETPRTKIGEKKKATEKLAILFDTADKAIELMDYAVGIVKDEQIDFVNAYKTNRKLVDTNAGYVSLRAKAIELTNGVPLKGVIFTFKPDGIKINLTGGMTEIIKKTAEKGSFHLKNMPSGTYKVVVNKPGYKEKEVSVSVADGERSELTVELEKA